MYKAIEVIGSGSRDPQRREKERLRDCVAGSSCSPVGDLGQGIASRPERGVMCEWMKGVTIHTFVRHAPRHRKWGGRHV
ncbi:hypothetical protein MTBLM1_10027 [Rhodospirillaceae bacterium LM-1]|nr:hypothetical protein MTBLM1_10027 [Rhodospirillaceae bacterium LM-1]